MIGLSILVIAVAMPSIGERPILLLPDGIGQQVFIGIRWQMAFGLWIGMGTKTIEVLLGISVLLQDSFDHPPINSIVTIPQRFGLEHPHDGLQNLGHVGHGLDPLVIRHQFSLVFCEAEALYYVSLE